MWFSAFRVRSGYPSSMSRSSAKPGRSWNAGTTGTTGTPETPKCGVLGGPGGLGCPGCRLSRFFRPPPVPATKSDLRAAVKTILRGLNRAAVNPGLPAGYDLGYQHSNFTTRCSMSFRFIYRLHLRSPNRVVFLLHDHNYSTTLTPPKGLSPSDSLLMQRYPARTSHTKPIGT